MIKLPLLFMFLLSMCSNTSTPPAAALKPANDKEPHIQIALLLDTSNSMDGMIDQAKAQLWKMVNQLAATKKDGKLPKIEISLYEYGKSSLLVKEGYIRQILPLTTDLDKISAELFALKTNGGEEYCGWVIKTATADLQWSDNQEDMKLVIICGNEGFNQGSVSYALSCKEAVRKGIVVNTIFCGNCDNGIKELWKDGADIGQGEYMCINTDDKVQHIPTPYDDEIIQFNQKLNNTYIGYGKEGEMRKEMQVKQDANAESAGRANAAQRAYSKASFAYQNSSWDLVDAYKDDKTIISKVDKKTLPQEYQGLSDESLKAKIEAVTQQREEIKGVQMKNYKMLLNFRKS